MRINPHFFVHRLKKSFTPPQKKYKFVPPRGTRDKMYNIQVVGFELIKERNYIGLGSVQTAKSSSNLGDFLFYIITIKNLIKLECNENKF